MSKCQANFLLFLNKELRMQAILNAECGLVDTQQPAGHFHTIWDGADDHNLPVASGVYFCRMEVG